ncbi:MAG: hypothetical protein KUF79_17360 [Candidatus Thiodiazotropha sp. (ex Ctena orbiculata)]|nr:hypothetical protein [Candidatus Thiodiazotropha taylori]
MIDNVEFNPPLEGLIASLQELEGDLPVRGMRSALVASIKPFKANLRGRIHDVTGSLKRSIGHKSLSRTAKTRLGYNANQVVLLVGATKKVAGSIGAPPGKKWDQNYKLHWLERGVKPHDIPDVSKGWSTFRARKMLMIGGAFRKTVEHPGFSGRQLVWKSLQATRSQQQSLFYQGLVKYLDRHIP